MRKKERKEIKANVSFPPRKIQTNPAAIEKKVKSGTRSKKKILIHVGPKAISNISRPWLHSLYGAKKGKKRKEKKFISITTRVSLNVTTWVWACATMHARNSLCYTPLAVTRIHRGKNLPPTVVPPAVFLWRRRQKDFFIFRRPNLDATWQNGAKKRE